MAPTREDPGCSASVIERVKVEKWDDTWKRDCSNAENGQAKYCLPFFYRDNQMLVQLEMKWIHENKIWKRHSILIFFFTWSSIDRRKEVFVQNFHEFGLWGENRIAWSWVSLAVRRKPWPGRKSPSIPSSPLWLTYIPSSSLDPIQPGPVYILLSLKPWDLKIGKECT